MAAVTSPPATGGYCWERMPDMYEVSHGRPRGASSSQPGRELPILFHLVDVSRPRAKPPEKPMG